MCDYCKPDGGITIVNNGFLRSYILIDLDSQAYLAYDVECGKIYYIPIDYCPICGRKLT